MLEAGDFDLVLLDILTPEMDGYDVPARLKGNLAQRDLPVTVISALDEGKHALHSHAGRDLHLRPSAAQELGFWFLGQDLRRKLKSARFELATNWRYLPAPTRRLR